MKRNRNILLIGAAVVSLAACKQELKAPTETEIDKLVSEKVEMAKQEMQKACDESIMAMANMKADSILGVALNKPATTATAPAPKPKKTTPTKTKKADPEPVQPKANPKPSNTSRPGANNTTNGSSNTNRPGANNTTNGSSNKNRPGASNTNRPGANK